jgi:hypothetical protein
MNTDLAVMPSANTGSIYYVIEVAVGKEEQIDMLRGKVAVSPLWGIKQDSTLWGFYAVSIGP